MNQMMKSLRHIGSIIRENKTKALFAVGAIVLNKPFEWLLHDERGEHPRTHHRKSKA